MAREFFGSGGCFAGGFVLGREGRADYYDETSFIVPAATPDQSEFLTALAPGGTWEKEDTGYWFWSTDTMCDLECILDDLVEYYRRFFSEGTLEIHIANYCSKPRVDEFGGSCIVVTATVGRMAA